MSKNTDNIKRVSPQALAEAAEAADAAEKPRTQADLSFLSPIEEIIEDARNGRMFILVDDESFLPPEIAAIDSMRLETDFVVLDDGTEAPVTVVEPEPPEEGGDEYLSLDDIL